MKICAISDTHNQHHQLNIPECDIIMHAGDTSHNEIQFMHFIDWYKSLPIKHKILVAGNHDYTLSNMDYEKAYTFCKENGIIYLEDTSVEIEGIKIHGSPWSVNFGNWAFMADDFDLQEYWEQIPLDTNILITHGPAYGILDTVKDRAGNTRYSGSRTLKERTHTLNNLKYHICGHIHESYGIHTNNYTTMNCSVYEYQNIKNPIVFEY